MIVQNISPALVWSPPAVVEDDLLAWVRAAPSFSTAEVR
jgi:hypothetical protein